MNYLNAQQLAFILDIKKEDARAKMCNAWCKEHGIEKIKSPVAMDLLGDVKAERDRATQKIKDDYPLAMPVEMLSRQLNLPNLQESIDDIVNNYLVRPSSKKWILCDYPEKLIEKWTKSGEPKVLSIPAALKSLLPKEAKDKITNEWQKRYPKYRVKI